MSSGQSPIIRNYHTTANVNAIPAQGEGVGKVQNIRFGTVIDQELRLQAIHETHAEDDEASQNNCTEHGVNLWKTEYRLTLPSVCDENSGLVIISVFLRSDNNYNIHDKSKQPPIHRRTHL